MNRFSDSLTQQMLRNLFLMEIRDHLLTQTRSDLMKQEHRVESLNNCTNELQQQTYAQRLELQDALFADMPNLEENKNEYDYKKN